MIVLLCFLVLQCLTVKCIYGFQCSQNMLTSNAIAFAVYINKVFSSAALTVSSLFIVGSYVEHFVS